MISTAKIELHLHLDGSLYLPWAYKKSIERGVIPPDWTFVDYYTLLNKKQFSSREESIKKFDLPCAIMQTEEDLFESIYYLIKRLDELGLIYAEIRYASQQHTLGGLTQEETIAALIKGIEKAKSDFPDIDIGLINCMMHKGPDANFNMKENMEAIEASRKYLGKGLVGMDLAGFENNGDFMLYAPLFDKCKEYGIPFTCHAGEMGLGEHVPMAIDMGAYRIGHGVNCVNNPEWLDRVVKAQIPLEVCVGSNHKIDKNYASHEITQLYNAGVKITVNSDNMIFASTDLVNEHNQLRQIGFTTEDLNRFTLNAVEAAFCSDDIKDKLYKKLGIQK